MTPALHPDHLRLLSLANAAFKARDDRALWTRSLLEGAERHGAACDALWDELERQAVEQDGSLMVLEHPSAKLQRIARQMRSEIVSTVQDALTQALEDIAYGPRLDPEDEE